MNTARFRGSTVALITPFDRQDRIDEPSLRKLVDRQIEGGTDVILPCGTTGESATLSDTEQMQVLEIVIDQVAGRRPVMCGAGSNCTRKAVELARNAEKAGGDALLSVAPYYNKPTQEGLFQHFQAIAEATALPLFVYNVPARTASNLTAETTLRLAALPAIAGIKEASGNLSQIMAILRDRPEEFLVLSGDDAFALPLMALGADGVVSVVANQVPDVFSEMVHAALAGEWETARSRHFRLLELMELNFIESNPIPVKASLAMMGLIEEQFRLPLVPIGEAHRHRLHQALERLGLIE